MQAAKDVFERWLADSTARLVRQETDPAPGSGLKARFHFACSDVVILLEVAAEGDEITISGSYSPPGDARMALTLGDSGLALVVSGQGTFRFPPVAHGTVRLSVEWSDRAPVRTDWVNV